MLKVPKEDRAATEQVSSGLGPNMHLIGVSGGRTRLTTPCLVVDQERLERNLDVARKVASKSGMVLWPHAKTHKCSRLAKLQLDRGAERICVANIHEAEVFVAAGVSPLLITSPVIGSAKIDRLMSLIEQAPDLLVVIDNAANAAQLSATAANRGVIVRVLIDVDVGMQRTGVGNLEQIQALAKGVSGFEALKLVGVQGYSGRIQHIHSYAQRHATYGEHLGFLRAGQEALRGMGCEISIVTGGGTGSLFIDAEFGVITAHQCGSYIFMDAQYIPVEFKADREQIFDTALSLRATVVSANAKAHVTIDAGIKSLATDGPKPIVMSGAPSGSTYEFFGDEHGKLLLPEGGERLAPGASVELMTPHCDPTINLHDYLHIVREDTLVDIWPIDARGSL